MNSVLIRTAFARARAYCAHRVLASVPDDGMAGELIQKLTSSIFRRQNFVRGA